MARVLVVGCGCRGRELARRLAAAGHAVRGTTRHPERLAAIETAGVEAAQADPDRLGTLLPQLDGVSAICWLLGSANGDREALAALHGPRLESLLRTIVDTPVRGFVYEAAGSAPAELLAEGAGLVRAAGERWRIPVAVLDEQPADLGGWLDAAAGAVEQVLR